MKAGREHRVPHSNAALALLQALQRDGNVVFPDRGKDAALSDMSLTAVLRRMGRKDITVHGFCSTFRDWYAESVGNSFSREVCEHALPHSLPDKVEAAYRRGDLLEAENADAGLGRFSFSSCRRRNCRSADRITLNLFRLSEEIDDRRTAESFRCDHREACRACLAAVR